MYSGSANCRDTIYRVDIQGRNAKFDEFCGIFGKTL